MVVICVFLCHGLIATSASGVRSPSANPTFVSEQSSGNTPVLVAPFKLVEEHIVVEVEVNGASARPFIVDSGATDDFIDDKIALKMGLQLNHTKERYGVGLGEGKTELSRIKGISLNLEGKEIFRGEIGAVPMEGDQGNGLDADGMLGFPLFKRFVVEIDYAHRVIKLYDPHRYRYQGSGHILPIRVNGVPFVQTEIVVPGGQHLKAKMEVDTGSDVVISLNAPFEMKHRLPYPGEVTILNEGVGVGGEFVEHLGRLEAIGIGDAIVERPLVAFTDADTERGTNASGKYDGSVGDTLLARFTVIFEYAHREMILEPNSEFGKPFKTDVCGIWFGNLVRGKNHLATGKMNFSKDSPAVLAGLQANDQLIAIDGKPTTEFRQSQLVDLFSEEGKKFTFTIERAGKRVDITFTSPRLL